MDEHRQQIDPLVQFTETRIREVSQSIPEEMFGTTELQTWVERLNASRKQAGGVGIAAPQIGLLSRLIVIEYDSYERVGFGIVPAQPLVAWVNPEIIWYSEEKIKAGEGCLSVQGYEGFVVRPAKVGVLAWTTAGQRVEFEADSLYARVLQHEVDHINGILYVDRLTSLRDFRKIAPVVIEDPVLAYNRLIERGK